MQEIIGPWICIKWLAPARKRKNQVPYNKVHMIIEKLLEKKKNRAIDFVIQSCDELTVF